MSATRFQRASRDGWFVAVRSEDGERLTRGTRRFSQRCEPASLEEFFE